MSKLNIFIYFLFSSPIFSKNVKMKHILFFISFPIFSLSPFSSFLFPSFTAKHTESVTLVFVFLVFALSIYIKFHFTTCLSLLTLRTSPRLPQEVLVLLTQPLISLSLFKHNWVLFLFLFLPHLQAFHLISRLLQNVKFMCQCVCVLLMLYWLDKV